MLKSCLKEAEPSKSKKKRNIQSKCLSMFRCSSNNNNTYSDKHFHEDQSLKIKPHPLNQTIDI